VSDVGYFFVLQDIVFGIANAFYVNEAGVVFYSFGEIFGLARVNESDFDAEFWESLAEERDGPAVSELEDTICCPALQILKMLT